MLRFDRDQAHVALLQLIARGTRQHLRHADPHLPTAKRLAPNHISSIILTNKVKRATQLVAVCPHAQGPLYVHHNQVPLSNANAYRTAHQANLTAQARDA